MSPSRDRVPRWPPLAGAAALAGAIVLAALAPVAAALPALLAGLDRTAPGVVLLAGVLTAAGTVVLVTRLARLTRPVSAAQLGLRAPDELPVALLLAGALGLAVAGVAVAWWALGGDLAAALPVPPELDTRTATARAYDLPLREPVAFGPELAASALARCVLPAVAGEILLRGFAFPALSAWRGPLAAALIVSILFGGLFRLAGATGVAVLSMLLSLGLCALYLRTGSLLPGIALAAAASAAGLGAACALPAAGIVLLALACAGVAAGLAAVALLPRPSERRRAVLRGSAA
jgi:membrane protease YdiL (CAAX protease family)